jgi:hypothetical protein
MHEEGRGGVRWRRLLAEGVVIVSSVLLALAADAWWDARVDAIQSHALVAALAADFESAGNLAETTRTFHGRAMGAAERLLTYAEEGGVPETERAAADSAFSLLFYSMVPFEPPMGTVETILSSGRLDLLDDRELVGELTQWTSIVQNYKSWESALKDSFYHSLVPLMGARLNLQDLDRAVPWEVPWPHDRTPAVDLLTDQSFRSALYLHYVLLHNTTSAFPLVEESIGRIAGMTSRELN